MIFIDIMFFVQNSYYTERMSVCVCFLIILELNAIWDKIFIVYVVHTRYILLDLLGLFVSLASIVVVLCHLIHLLCLLSNPKYSGLVITAYLGTTGKFQTMIILRMKL